jgi:hypothetical protein
MSIQKCVAVLRYLFHEILLNSYEREGYCNGGKSA